MKKSKATQQALDFSIDFRNMSLLDLHKEMARIRKFWYGKHMEYERVQAAANKKVDNESLVVIQSSS